MRDQGRVSVIVPVYNCKRYLSRCLQSIVHQTYSNIEVILVDDGSVDGSSEICDAYAAEFPVIKVVHQDNAGPGAARNTALEMAVGVYVTYIDADDYVAAKYVEVMVGLLQKYNADIAEAGIVTLYPLRNNFEQSDGSVMCFEGSDRLIQDYFSEKKQIRNCVGGRMYHMERFHKIRFSEKSIGEDSEYSLKMLLNCRRLVKYNQCMYVYRAYQESLTRGAIGRRHFDVIDISFRDAMLAERVGVKVDNWEYIFSNFIKISYELLEKVAAQKKEHDFTPEIENITAVFQEMKQLALKQGICLPEQLPEDIRQIDSWAEEYRRRNRRRLLLGRLRRLISGIAAVYKVHFLYEYRIDDKS